MKIKVIVIKRRRFSACVEYEENGTTLTVIIPQKYLSRDCMVSRSILEMGIPADEKTFMEVQR
jgi:hypothetical protein